jgi:nitrate/TMAO reductase-like tetraheme cytochrome c subunit
MRRVADPFVISLLVVGTLALTVVMRSEETRAAEVVNHDFLGAERCRSCHMAEYDMWASGPHARAMESLRDSEKKDQRCIACHTMVPADLDPMLTGVQCETCHGPGRYYAKPHTMRDRELRERLGFIVPDEKTCKTCHAENTASLRPFSYAEARERIRHWPLDEATAK